MKDFLHWFVEGQSHFGMPGGAKTSLAPEGTHIECSSFKPSTLTLDKHAPKT